MGVGGNEALGFVCVEAASGGSNSLSLAPGEEAHLTLQAYLLH
jgi:hypothetical protein